MLLCSSAPMAAATRGSCKLCHLLNFFVVLDQRSLLEMDWEFISAKVSSRCASYSFCGRAGSHVTVWLDFFFEN